MVLYGGQNLDLHNLQKTVSAILRKVGSFSCPLLDGEERTDGECREIMGDGELAGLAGEVSRRNTARVDLRGYRDCLMVAQVVAILALESTNDSGNSSGDTKPEPAG